MSFVITQPELITAAAHDLADLGWSAATAGPTPGIVPAAADEVSALTAVQFATHALMYRAVATEAAAIHHQFMATLGASADRYAATDEANASAVR